jgi:predicted nucleotidyltransferase
LIAHTSLPLSATVQTYLAAALQLCSESGVAMVSVILFGSAVIGGFQEGVSDVDLILVLADGANADVRRRLCKNVRDLEIKNGFRHESVGLEALVEKATANDKSFIVCMRADLLSGEPARVLNVHPAQAFFVDRIVIPSIVSSAVTVWGEDLFSSIAMQPIRRLDGFKALFALISQIVLTIVVYPLLPNATKFAMGALKRSVHSCYFCYHRRRASFEEEIGFFRRTHGASGALDELLALRRTYKSSFGFVLRCAWTLVCLHLRTARDNNFQAP